MSIRLHNDSIVAELPFEYYDALYSFKDYLAESKLLKHEILERVPKAKTLLDVACGSGKHLEQFRTWINAEGIDFDPSQVRNARQRLQDIPVHQGDMRDFNLGKTFDVVTCLFSAIGYMNNPKDLDTAVSNMARHLNPGGLLLVEPWLTPDRYQAGGVYSLNVDEPNLKITRMNITELVEGRTVMKMHYMVGTPQGISTFEEVLDFGLYGPEQYVTAVKKAGLEGMWQDGGPTGRGLVIGIKANE